MKNGTLFISPGCSYNCIFCNDYPKVDQLALKKQEYDLMQNLEFYLQSGVRHIEISGQDPGEYEDLPNLISYMKKQGVNWIQLSTNGWRLADPHFTEKLAKAGLNKVRLPLYGTVPEFHDTITQKPGSLFAALRAIQNCQNFNIDFIAQAILLQQNYIHVPELCYQFEGMLDKLVISPLYVATPEHEKMYVPANQVGLQLCHMINYVKDRHPSSSHPAHMLHIIDIPHCAIGIYYPGTHANIDPPNEGLQYENRRPEEIQSAQSGVPTYRIRKHVAMCESCAVKDICNGFFLVDIDVFGVTELYPI